MKGKVLFLGSGGSLGVPVVGCSCAVCTSSSPFNKRLRPAILVQTRHKQFLIDVGPDFREQMLRHHINQLDGVLLTHAHHDHTAGLDELRSFYYKTHKAMPILLSKSTEEDVQRRFYYIFNTDHAYEKFVPRLDLKLLADRQGEMEFEGVPIRYVTYYQTNMPVNGFIFDNLAYLSDISQYDASLFEQLKGIDILIISALRFTPSYFHLTVDEAVDFANKVGVKEAWLMHISHDLDHEKTNAYLPSHVKLAYDGLEIEFG